MRQTYLRRSIIGPAVLALLVLVVGISPAAGQVVIQSFDAQRDGPPNPFATRGFVTSPYFSAVRQAVTSRYGGAVVFGTPEAPGGVSRITAEVLAGVDIFVVTGMNLGLTPEENCLLDAFVANGGAVFSFRNEWMPPTVLGTQLGSFGGTGNAGVVDASHPLINGPFGNVGSAVRVGANSQYMASGAGWPVLADGGRTMLVTLGPETGHMGRAVVVGDEEIFLNGPTPFGGDFNGTRAANQLLFVNAIAFLSGAPGLDAAGVTGLGVCLDADADGFNAVEDCDDGAGYTYPGAPELLDGRDNDCDGAVDESLDDDADGVPNLTDACAGTPAGSAVDPQGCPVACSEPGPGGGPEDADGDGHPAATDCNDADPSIHPGALDLPGNTVDEDCDGSLGACDPGADWKNHGQYVACVVREVSSMLAAGSLDRDTAQRLIREAARGGEPAASEPYRGHGRGRGF